MSKIDFALIESTPSIINPLRNRELNLSSLRLVAIENLALTKDLNDTLNFNNNAIPAVTNFPVMTRLNNLYLANNRVARIDANVAKYLPNLETLVLSGNKIESIYSLPS